MEWTIQGPKGPEPALRPPQAVLENIRNMDSLQDRLMAVRDLAYQGYTMCVPIDAWCWGEDATAAQWRMYGYTWVPSALMQPVKVAPGLSYPGAASYDKDQPPLGAILVPPKPAPVM